MPSRTGVAGRFRRSSGDPFDDPDQPRAGIAADRGGGWVPVAAVEEGIVEAGFDEPGGGVFLVAEVGMDPPAEEDRQGPVEGLLDGIALRAGEPEVGQVEPA